MIPCTKIFRGLETIHNKNNKRPLFVWNVTNKCNLRCRHCYRDSGILHPSSKHTKELSDKKSIQLVNQIKKLNPVMVLLSGGEPLLRKNLFCIVRRCKEMGLKVGLSTNGTLIDKNMANKIKRGGIDYVGISIDGKESLHDKFRGSNGACRLSWGAIKYLNNLGVKAGVRFALTKNNKNDLFYILDKTLRSGAKRFCLYHLVYCGRGDISMDISVREKTKIMDKFFYQVKALCLLDENFEVLTTDNYADRVYMSKYLAGGKRIAKCMESDTGCPAGEKVIYLDSTGSIYPCQFLRDKSLGNVMKKSLIDIWRNKHNRLLNRLRNKRSFLTGRCGRCTHKNICAGCRSRAKSRWGSLWDEDPACYLTSTEIYG